jgi:hypothetical protein
LHWSLLVKGSQVFPVSFCVFHFISLSFFLRMRAADALRYQGGPGASSLFGLLVELGPLMLNDQSLDNPEYKKTGIPQLVRNPASWSAKANLIVVSTALHCTALHCTANPPV